MTRLIVLLLSLGPGLALAQPTLSTAPGDTATYTWVGPALNAGLQAGWVGDALLGELGAQAFSLRHDSPRWLVLWNASLGVRGGVLGNEHPYTSMIGGRAMADVEGVYRFSEEPGWAPHVSAKLGANLQVLGHPGLALSDLGTINASDGVGGVSATGAVRVGGGYSLFDGPHAVLLEGFIQEAFGAPGVVLPGSAFSELGVAARVDLTQRFAAGVEFFGGLAPTQHSSSLNLDTQAYHLEVGGFLRKTFESGVWLSLNLSWGRDSVRMEYLDTHTTYNSIQAATFVAGLGVGFALWRAP